MHNNHSTQKKVTTWLILITVLGLFMSLYYQDKIVVAYWVVLFISLFASLTTMGSSALVGYYILNRLQTPEPIANQLLIGTAASATGLFAGFLNLQLAYLYFEPESMKHWQSLLSQWILPIVIVIFTAAIITTRIEVALARLRNITPNRTYFDQPNKLAAKNELVIRHDSGQTIVATSSIIYFSAQKTKTVIHTTTGDFESSILLKNFLEQLPGKQFMRIHKSYGVNLLFCARLKYNAGGSYILFLKDEDETNLPVGRTYAPAVRKRVQGK